MDNSFKNYKDQENFPVASFLIPKKHRKTIVNIYNFARYADEIADSEYLIESNKLQELKNLKQGIKTQDERYLPEFLRDILEDIKNLKFSTKHLVFLLEAFEQDVTKNRYENLNDTLNYCKRSANTIGRIFLEVTEEFGADVAKADKICTVLQLLNHLQDLKNDYKKLGRIYFDRTYFRNESDLELFSESEDVKNGKIKILGYLQSQLDDAKNITEEIKSFRVRAELNTIIFVADSLIKKLSNNDIITRRIELSKKEKFSCLIKGFKHALKQKKVVKEFNSEEYAKNSGSSFLEAMLSLSKVKQKAILNFYSFCKLVDDSADNPESKYSPIFWQQEVEEIYKNTPDSKPKHPASKRVAIIANNLKIEKKYLAEIVEGQNMDKSGVMFMPSSDEFELYCYRVASCVGIVAAYIFGFNKENKEKVLKFAENLGKYFQYINILRDFEEDLERKRVYIPKEILNKYKIQEIDFLDRSKNASELLDKMKPAFKDVISHAETTLEKAKEILPNSEKKNMKAAFLMEKVYSKKLEKIKGNVV